MHCGRSIEHMFLMCGVGIELSDLEQCQKLKTVGFGLASTVSGQVWLKHLYPFVIVLT